MRLTGLHPKWWAEPGRRGQGVVFDCPHCFGTVLCVAFANPLDGGAPWDVGTHERRPIGKLWETLFSQNILLRGTVVVPPGVQWHRDGDTFETLTIHPSVDASPAGCWHGWIRGGEAESC